MKRVLLRCVIIWLTFGGFLASLLGLHEAFNTPSDHRTLGVFSNAFLFVMLCTFPFSLFISMLIKSLDAPTNERTCQSHHPPLDGAKRKARRIGREQGDDAVNR